MNLPNHNPLTLAEVISSLAWGQAFTCEAFATAELVEELAAKVSSLAAAVPPKPVSPALRARLDEATAARAELEAAAGGCEWCNPAYWQLLDTATEKLFQAITAGRVKAFGKLDRADPDWTDIPPRWFWIDPEDPRPPISLPDADLITRDGHAPISLVVQRFPPPPVEWWYLVRFQRDEIAREFSDEGRRSRDNLDVPDQAAPRRLQVGGKNFFVADELLAKEALALIDAGKAIGPWDAARSLVTRIEGTRNEESRIKRLSAVIKKLVESRDTQCAQD